MRLPENESTERELFDRLITVKNVGGGSAGPSVLRVTSFTRTPGTNSKSSSKIRVVTYSTPTISVLKGQAAMVASAHEDSA